MSNKKYSYRKFDWAVAFSEVVQGWTITEFFGTLLRRIFLETSAGFQTDRSFESAVKTVFSDPQVSTDGGVLYFVCGIFHRYVKQIPIIASWGIPCPPCGVCHNRERVKSNTRPRSSQKPTKIRYDCVKCHVHLDVAITPCMGKAEGPGNNYFSMAWRDFRALQKEMTESSDWKKGEIKSETVVPRDSSQVMGSMGLSTIDQMYLRDAILRGESEAKLETIFPLTGVAREKVEDLRKYLPEYKKSLMMG